MKIRAMHLVAVLSGMAMGWAVTAQPIVAFFAPTPVTWEASACAAGVYNITSTARSLDGPGTYHVTSPKVALPRPVVIQEFPDLPSGLYSVTARATRSDGHVLDSAIQTLRSLGAGSAIGAGRSRPPTVEPTGVARPRRPRDTSSPPAPTSASRQSVRVQATTTTVVPAAKLVAPKLIAPKPIDVIGPDADWRRIEMVDYDLDGIADEIRIELGDGSIWVWRANR
jgi:hypothetical protein